MNKKLLFTCLVTGALAFGNHLRAQPATATGPFVEILATDPTALEGTSTAAFTLIRDGDTNADLTVPIDIYGSASNGVDYAKITSPITIPKGYLAVDILVSPIIDAVNRGNKTVIVRIETNLDYQVGGARSAVVTIIDDVFNVALPTVTISTPTNDSTFSYPNEITLTAEASDPGAKIQSVSFYANDDFVGRVTNAPYTLTLTNSRAGRYSLFARAVNNLNQSALSPVVNFTVTDVLPVVVITTPTNGSDFTAHQNIPIAATVTDADASATIASVDFFDNGRFLAAVTNAPYQIVWSNAPSGLFTLQATATDNAGQKGYSKGVLINISRP